MYVTLDTLVPQMHHQTNSSYLPQSPMGNMVQFPNFGDFPSFPTTLPYMNQFGVTLPHSPNHFSPMIHNGILPHSTQNITSCMQALGLYPGSTFHYAILTDSKWLEFFYEFTFTW